MAGYEQHDAGKHAAPRSLPSAWDIEVDVVVAGYGFAGAIAAMEATDLGAEVVILEKMAHPGGISICSGGGVRTASDASGAFAYLKETCAGLTPDPVLRTFAEGMVQAPAFMEELARVNGAEIHDVEFPGNYPFPGLDAFGFFMYGRIPDFDQFSYYPHVRGLRGGARHFKVIEDNVVLRRIRVLLRTAVRRLYRDPDGRVVGVTAERDGQRLNVRARRGVILACGGFEADDDLKAQHLPARPMFSVAYRGNTGDGIRMAQELGAPLWHMSNVHGSYGFRHTDPAYPFGIRMAQLPNWIPGQPVPERAIMAWIVVDQAGERYMNEYPPYMQDTGHRPMDALDLATQRRLRIPSHVIFDEDGRGLYPVGLPTFNDPDVFFEWSDDNLAEVDLGILRRADTIAELALSIGVDRETLGGTVERWNRFCERGVDEDFGRPSETLRPLRQPPFYHGAVWPLVSNTQGGPVHDEHWRVLDAFGQPIPGLYEAGELGSVFGHLYLGGGNLAECYVGGWTAARDAVALEPWG